MTEPLNSAVFPVVDATAGPIEAVEPLDLTYASNGTSASQNVDGNQSSVFETSKHKGDVSSPFLSIHTLSRVPPESIFPSTVKEATLLELSHSPWRSPNAEGSLLCTSPSTVSTQASSSVSFYVTDSDRSIKELDVHVPPVDKLPSNHNLVAALNLAPLVDRFGGYGEKPDGAVIAGEKWHKTDTGLVRPERIPTEGRLKTFQGKTLQQLMKAIELPCSNKEVVLSCQRCLLLEGCAVVESERALGTKVSGESVRRPLNAVKPIHDAAVLQRCRLGVQGSRVSGEDVCSKSNLEGSLNHGAVEEKDVSLQRNALEASVFPCAMAETAHKKLTRTTSNGHLPFKSLCCEAQPAPFSLPKLQEGFDTARRLCVQQMRRLAEVFPFDLPGWGRTSVGTEWHIGTILQCENWLDLQVYVWAFHLGKLPKSTSSGAVQQPRIATMSLRPLTDYEFFESCGDIVARLNAIRWSATVERDNFDGSLHRFIHRPKSGCEDSGFYIGSSLCNTQGQLPEWRKNMSLTDFKRWLPKRHPKFVTATVVSRRLDSQRRQPAFSSLQRSPKSSKLLKGQLEANHSTNTKPEQRSSYFEMQCTDQSALMWSHSSIATFESSAASPASCKASNEVASKGSSCIARTAVSSSHISQENGRVSVPWSSKRLKVEERLDDLKSEDCCSCAETNISPKLACSSSCVNDGVDSVCQNNRSPVAISSSQSSNVLRAKNRENSLLQTSISGGSDREKAKEDNSCHHDTYSDKNRGTSFEVEGKTAKSVFGTVFQVNRVSATEMSFSAAVSAALALLGATVRPSEASMPAEMTLYRNSLTQAMTNIKGINRIESPSKGSGGGGAPECQLPNAGRCSYPLSQTIPKAVSQQACQAVTQQQTVLVSEQLPEDDFSKQGCGCLANDENSVPEVALRSSFEAKRKEYGHTFTKKLPQYSSTEVCNDRTFSFWKESTNNTPPHTLSTPSVNAYKSCRESVQESSQSIEVVPRYMAAEYIKVLKTETKRITTPPKGQETEIPLHQQSIGASPFRNTPSRGVATGIPLELIRKDDTVTEGEGGHGAPLPASAGLSPWKPSSFMSSASLRTSPKEKDVRKDRLAWATSTDPDTTEKNTSFSFTTPPQRSMKGVSFDRSKRNWEASWLDARTGRRVKKCFSEGRWGSSARKMAILARKEAEESGLISTRQHQHSAPSSVSTTRHSSGMIGIHHQQAKEQVRDPTLIAAKGGSNVLPFSTWRDEGVRLVATPPPSCYEAKGTIRLSPKMEDEQEGGGCVAGEGLHRVSQSFPRNMVRASWSDAQASTESQNRGARLDVKKGLDDNLTSHASLHFPSAPSDNGPCRSEITRLHTGHAGLHSSPDSATKNLALNSRLAFTEENRLSSGSSGVEANKLLSAASDCFMDKDWEPSTLALFFVPQDAKSSVESTGTKTLRPLCFAASPGYGKGVSTHVESDIRISERGSSSSGQSSTLDIGKGALTISSEEEQPLGLSQKPGSCVQALDRARRTTKLVPSSTCIQQIPQGEKSLKSSTVMASPQVTETNSNHSERIVATLLSNERKIGEWSRKASNVLGVKETVEEKRVAIPMTSMSHMLEAPDGEDNSRRGRGVCKVSDTVKSGVGSRTMGHSSELVQSECKHLLQPSFLYPVESYHRTALSEVPRPLTCETAKEASAATSIMTATDKHSFISRSKAIAEEGFQSFSAVSQKTTIPEREELPHSESSPSGTKRRKRKNPASPPGRRWTEFQPLPLPPARVTLKRHLEWYATDPGDSASLGMPLQCLYKTSSCHEMNTGLKDGRGLRYQEDATLRKAFFLPAFRANPAWFNQVTAPMWTSFG